MLSHRRSTTVSLGNVSPLLICPLHWMCMLRSVISDEPEESNPPSVFNSIDASFQMRLKELEEKQEVNSQFCTCTVYLDTLTMAMAIKMIMVVSSRFELMDVS